VQLTGDVRGRVLPITTTQSDCKPIASLALNGTKCFGGAARHVGFIKQIRATVNNSVLVDSGNYAYGTSFFTTFGGVANAEYFSTMKYDAWA
jgi:2',3'-cyclic-nucleotide 2'-phosphodiesterase (5'-nucleotidase family)